MSDVLRRELKQTTPFASPEEQAFLGFQVAAQRLMAPWAVFLRATANLSPAQYNVLRILRGAYPNGMTCGSVAQRLVTRLPDVTRLIDRLERRGLVRRERSESDRRVVQTFITQSGQACLEELDGPAEAMPRRLLGHLDQRRLDGLNAMIGEILAGMGTFP